jgi:hypothetical protein
MIGRAKKRERRWRQLFSRREVNASFGRGEHRELMHQQLA